ncbi:11537_t:CDS:2 [Racocetra persica]|nr:11537_t:CDS:2 [Racocetra persica]
MDFHNSPQDNSQEDSQEDYQEESTERDHLLISESIDAEVYSKDEEPGEVDNGNLIEQPNVNLASQALRLVKNYERKDGQKLICCLPSEDDKDF